MTVCKIFSKKNPGFWGWSSNINPVDVIPSSQWSPWRREVQRSRVFGNPEFSNLDPSRIAFARKKKNVWVWSPKPWKSTLDVCFGVPKMISDPTKTQVVGWLRFYKESVLWEIWIVNVSFKVEKERIILPITVGIQIGMFLGIPRP